MRQSIKEFVEIVAASLPLRGPIYEFGSLQVAGQEGFADLRPLFPGAAYVGCDMREGTGVERIENLHALSLPPESAGTVLCMDTLEHVEYPHTAMREIHRVLAPEGIAVISSHMNWRIHNHPYDYWRFTPEAFKSILKPFSSCFVGTAGRPDFPHTVVGVGFKGTQPDIQGLQQRFAPWHAKQLPPPWGRQSVGARIQGALKFFLPPVVYGVPGTVAWLGRRFAGAMRSTP
jgi:SAM-dependent methyltransferase